MTLNTCPFFRSHFKKILGTKSDVKLRGNRIIPLENGYWKTSSDRMERADQSGQNTAMANDSLETIFANDFQ